MFFFFPYIIWCLLDVIEHGAQCSAEDLEELKQKLPLTCPITMGRMVHPAKGRHCSHIHGFDLGTYLSFCNQAQVWNCPICQKPLPFNVRT